MEIGVVLYKTKFKWVLASLGLTCSCISMSESLQDIYSLAQDNDHRYKAALAAYEAGQENKNIAKSQLLPNIRGSASWTDRSVDQSGSSNLPNTRLPGEDDSTETGYAVVLEQTLFDLAAWRDFKSGAVGSNIAAMELRLEQQQLIVRTAEAYLNVLQSAENVQTALAEENALKHQLDQSRQRFEVGLSAITEVHESQAAFDSAVADRLIAEGRLGIAFEALEVLTGRSHSHVAPLRDDFAISPPRPENRDDWVQRALENNTDLKVAKLSETAAGYQAKARKADHYPRLTGGLQYSSFDNDRDSLNGNVSSKSDITTDTQQIRVTLTVPLFNERISATRRQSQHRAVQARERHLQARRDIVQVTRSLHLSVVTGVATIKARKQAIVSSQSALEATRAGYEVGTRDLIDVLNAQRTLYSAKRNYFTAVYDYILTTLQLKEAAGILSEKDISTLSASLDVTKKVSKSSH